MRKRRKSIKLSQIKMAEMVGARQSSLNRYELSQASPTFSIPVDIIRKKGRFTNFSLTFLKIQVIKSTYSNHHFHKLHILFWWEVKPMKNES